MVERIARAVVREPARIVLTSDLERLERRAYREALRLAEDRGDIAFLQKEVEKNQLTAEDRARIAKHHTPIAEWPDTEPDLMANHLNASRY
jgi:hypothetical protein